MIFVKNEKEQETFIQIFSHVIGMESGMEKYVMLIIKKGEKRNNGWHKINRAPERLEEKKITNICEY